MNLRCIYCQTPFTLGRAEMLNAIVAMNERHQNHYDAHCPRCRRANSISRQRMELFFPNWQAAVKEMASAPQEPPPPAPKAETPAAAALKTEPLPKAAKATVKKQPVEKKQPAEKKPAAKKSAEKAAAVPAKAKKPSAAPKPSAGKKPASAPKTPSASKAKKPAAKPAEPKTKKK